MPAPPTIYLVDDDPSFLTAVSRLLRAAGYAVQAFSSAADFLQRPADDTPGCVVVDLRMPGLDGMQLQTTLARTEFPPPVIFLTGHGDIPTSVRAMRGGAVDFLTKPVKKEALFEALTRALARSVTEREQRERLRRLRERHHKLTAREREVLAHVVSGQLNKQIADDLGASERTIKAHRANIMEKLEVRSVAELVRFVQELEAGLSTGEGTEGMSNQ